MENKNMRPIGSPRYVQQCQRATYHAPPERITIQQLRNQNLFLKHQLQMLLHSKQNVAPPKVVDRVLSKNQSTPNMHRIRTGGNQWSQPQQKIIIQNHRADNIEEKYQHKMNKLRMKKTPRNSCNSSQQNINMDSSQGRRSTSFRKLDHINQSIIPLSRCPQNLYIQGKASPKNGSKMMPAPSKLIPSNQQFQNNSSTNKMEQGIRYEAHMKRNNSTNSFTGGPYLPLKLIDTRLKIMVEKDSNGKYYRDKTQEERLLTARNSHSKTNSLDQVLCQEPSKLELACFDQIINQDMNQQSRIVSREIVQKVNSKRLTFNEMPTKSKFGVIQGIAENNIQNRKNSIKIDTRDQETATTPRQEQKTTIPASKRQASELKARAYFEQSQFDQLKKQLTRKSQLAINRIKQVQSKQELRMKLNGCDQNSKRRITTSYQQNKPPANEESMVSIEFQLKEFKKGLKKMTYGAYLEESNSKIIEN